MEKYYNKEIDTSKYNYTLNSNNINNTTKIKNPELINLENNALLTKSINKLPSNYNFEIYKCIMKVNSERQQLIESKIIKLNQPISVAIQLPDGFAHLSLILCDILQTFCDNAEVTILGDITYGACCIDDLGCKQLGIDLMLHYGHSCLVPITESVIKIMYIFVDILIDIEKCVEIIYHNFKTIDRQNSNNCSNISNIIVNKENNVKLNNQKDSDIIVKHNIDNKIYLMGSIQYNNSLFLVRKALINKGFKNIVIPQAKPRSSGEVLGCTSPVVPGSSGILIFVCDGRFHMESVMISNPGLTFYQFNPFLNELTLEQYDFIGMLKTRKNLINKCYNLIYNKKATNKKIGIVFGTLGRQGNEGILNRIIDTLNLKNIKYEIILLSEITEEKLLLFSKCTFFIQIACPRLSIDWGIHFSKPVMTPYEFYVIFEEVELKDKYPMDYYSYDGGKWSNYYNIIYKAKKVVNTK